MRWTAHLVVATPTMGTQTVRVDQPRSDTRRAIMAAAKDHARAFWMTSTEIRVTVYDEGRVAGLYVLVENRGGLRLRPLKKAVSRS